MSCQAQGPQYLPLSRIPLCLFICFYFYQSAAICSWRLQTCWASLKVSVSSALNGGRIGDLMLRNFPGWAWAWVTCFVSLDISSCLWLVLCWGCVACDCVPGVWAAPRQAITCYTCNDIASVRGTVGSHRAHRIAQGRGYTYRGKSYLLFYVGFPDGVASYRYKGF